MKSLGKQQRLTAVLTGISVMLAAIIGIEYLFLDPIPSRDDIVTEPVIPENAALPQYTARPYAHFDEILKRPLFYQDRRLPPIPKEAQPEAAPLEPLHLTLEGVAIGGGARVAVLRDERDREQIRLAEGMAHNGWVLESINSRGAEFRRGGDVTALELETAEGPVSTRRRIRRR